MAKRGAEAVACHAPWETFAPHAPPKRARSDPEPREPRCSSSSRAPCSGGGCKKRKRAEEEEEEMAAKRPAALEKRGLGEEQSPPATPGVQKGTRARRQEQAGLLPESDAAAGLGEALAQLCSPQTSMAEEHEDDVWHYNSFQYWRSPLPAIDLSDILDLEKENTVKSRHFSCAGRSEMET